MNDLRALEREIILAAVAWKTALADDDFDASLGRLAKSVDGFLAASVALALGVAESPASGPRRGDGRVFRRGGVYWIAYYVDGKEFRLPGGRTEIEAKMALEERKAIEAHDASLPKPVDLGPPKVTVRPEEAVAPAQNTPENPSSAGHKMPEKSAKPPEPNKTCRDCGERFVGKTSQTRCEECRASHEVSKRPAQDPKNLFADSRCLRCEEPFKSFQGQRHCDKCIKKRLEEAKANVGKLTS